MRLIIILTILFNQVGYYPNEEKTVVVEQTREMAYRIVNASGHTVWRGKAKETTMSPLSGKYRYTIDFTALTQPGTYTFVAGSERAEIRIVAHPLAQVLCNGMHAYYLQRSGEPLEPQYAGCYARAMGHPDTTVFIHPSAAGPSRKAGDRIASPSGWYDAGDYNKYINNSAFTVGILLNAWEGQSTYLTALRLAIPEHNNGVPDYLDEVLVNLSWMLTMQDPDDGGVYHKLTTPLFEEHIMPDACHQTRYVVQKSTPSTLGFAAAMAMAARIYGAYTETQPFARRALNASRRAFAWAVRHPHVYYDQPGNNDHYDPDIMTGMYEDTCATDEFFWAASELFITTGDTAFAAMAEQFAPTQFRLPTWGYVYGLGIYSAIVHGLQGAVWDRLRAQVVTYARISMDMVPGSSMHSPHGNRASDFYWGCNGEQCAGQGLALMMAYRLTGDKTFITGAIENMDWLLGRNALGYCYVTGMGTKQVMHPHHRLSAGDSIEAPLPGFLVGGPNAGKQDQSEIPEGMYPQAPDECYLDYHPSYASNEVAINWNAYLVALCTMIEANM